MIVATCVITLELTDTHSLKEKRRIVKSILARITQKFNVAAAEIDHQDAWQTAVIGLVTIGNESAYLHGLLEKSVAWIGKQRPDAPIADYRIEIW